MPKKRKTVENIDNLPLNERIAARERLIEAKLNEISTRAVVPRNTDIILGRDTESKVTRTAAVVSTWQEPPTPNTNYVQVAKEGYGGNEIIYTCIEELCTSAGEAIIRAYDENDNEIEKHEILDLLKQPNPFMNGYDYIASLIMYRSIAGNAYTEMVYNMGGSRVLELWLLRPDRMTVLPSQRNMVGGYRYTLGNYSVDYDVSDIGHYKTRNPLDWRYGLAPMSVILSRTDTDNFAREFTKAFFFNSAVPSTLISFKNVLDDQDRRMISQRLRRDYGGSEGWHNIMVTEQNEVEVKTLGQPMGSQGIAYPELDEINEARLCMVFGVPLTLVGARLGQRNSAYASRVADREIFWNQTLVPIYRELESSFNQWLVPKFKGVAYLKFDLTSVQAFADETDVLHARWRNNFIQGISGWRESRKFVGLVEDPDPDDVMLIPDNLSPIKVKDFVAGNFEALAPPVQAQLNAGTSDGRGDLRNGNGNDDKPFVPKPAGASRNGNGAHP